MESFDIYLKAFLGLGVTVDIEAVSRIEKYVSLLKKWNARINLIASNEWPLMKMFLQEGVWAAKFYSESFEYHLDIGSGAGFPAIPLKIVQPNIRMDLVESRFKRVSFLETVANELNLSRTKVHHCRLEEFLDANHSTWDCISWKAIKISENDLSILLKHSHPDTQFWIFHGKSLPVENVFEMENSLKLMRRETFPYKSEWTLSIYLPK